MEARPYEIALTYSYHSKAQDLGFRGDIIGPSMGAGP